MAGCGRGIWRKILSVSSSSSQYLPPISSSVQCFKGNVNLSKLQCSYQKQFIRGFGQKYISYFKEEEVYDIHDGTGNGPVIVPNNEAEYLIVGGGVMGLSLAFNLWRHMELLTPAKASKYLAPTILVVERDPTMSKASTPLAVGGIRQQFSHPCNITLSLKSSEYLRNIKFHLGLAGHPTPDIQFQPQGYLFLATQDGAEQLMENYAIQVENGAKVMLLTETKLKELFPWINTDVIELASYGLENEGWFDPWSLLQALKAKLKSLGIRYVHGEIVGFKKRIYDTAGTENALYGPLPDGSMVEFEDRLDGAYIKLPDIDKPVYIRSRAICNCAGPWSKNVAEMLGIGVYDDPYCRHPIMKTALPVEPRKRWVYTVHCPDGPIFDCPLLVDPSGFYFRREGFNGLYLCGMTPPDDGAIDHSNLDIDYDFFHEEVWPRMAHRVPVFEKLKLKSAWAGYYEYNTFDQNAIIGRHPYYTNFNFLTGFSGHGIQMAMGASACLAEQLVTGPDKLHEEINVDAFSFDRLVHDRPIKEINIV